MEKLYKITGPDGEACHGGTGFWPKPWEGNPGEWTDPIERVIPCQSGYHLLRLKDISTWLKLDCILWEAEGQGENVVENDKVVFSSARLINQVGVLTAQILGLAATQFAKRVLPIFEKEYPNDLRPRKALEAAARAAGAAARAARAAEAAAGVAGAAGAAEAAAWAAEAAEAAARVAKKVEQKAQGRIILELLKKANDHNPSS